MFHYSKIGSDPVSSGHVTSDSADQSKSRIYEAYLKRLVDITMVVVFLPVVLPLVLLAALIINRDGAPAFYGQPRVGRNGKIFTCWKLRTMVADAEERLARYLEKNPAARSEWDSTQKLKSDPRITRVGRFLRKTSLDELPQIYNVLVGDMSLVGPRPMMPEQREIYPGTAYFTLRPGITGLWQISDRNNCTFADRATFDTRYAHQMSFALDTNILARTISVVFRATGY